MKQKCRPGYTRLPGISSTIITGNQINAGISYTAAKSRVERARYKLSGLLMNCCHYEFDKYGVVTHYHPIKCCCPSRSLPSTWDRDQHK